MVLDETYDLLRNVGIVTSESDFSENWLGCSESYLRTLRFKKAHPSIGSIAILGSRLQKAGEQMLGKPQYRPLGARFIAMSERCHALVNQQSVELDLA
jgi:hypothetical protein